MASYTYTSQNNYLDTLAYGNNDSVKYTYDQQGRVTQQTYEDGATISYQYDNDGALATVTDSASGISTTYYYDFIDRMMKYVETGSGYSHSVGYEYDTINNLTKMVETINGAEYSTAYTYDDDNRVTSVTRGNAVRNYIYDTFGRASQQTTKHGTSTIKTDSFTFTAPSGTTTSSQIAGHTIDAASYDRTFAYTYDNNGNILSVSGNGKTVSYVYDSANQLVRENNEISGKTRIWTYDDGGNIQSRNEYAYTTGALGTVLDTIAYTYADTQGWGDLLTSYDGQTVYSDPIGNPVSDGTWSYDWQHGRQLARIAGMTDDGYASAEYTYNADGIRTQKEVTAYTLEDVGTRTGLYLCSDGEIRYFTDGEPTYAGLVQDEQGNYYYINSSYKAVRSIDYWVNKSNDLIEPGPYTFGSDGRMIYDQAYGEDGTLFTGLRVDADGEIRYYMNGVPTAAGLVLVNGDYYYINSSKKAVRNCTYTVTNTNDLLPEGDYTFDADGKMVQTNAVMTMAADSGYQVWVPGATTTYNYVYNGDKLSQMTVGSNLLYFSYDASGTPMAVLYNGTNYYYVTNIQGDVIAILNTSGTAVVEYAYDAWGNIISTTGSMASTLGVHNPLRYRSYVYDSEYGLYYLQSRYYNPEVGRFLNADAFATTGRGLLGNNMFAYCNNNPVRHIDSSGCYPLQTAFEFLDRWVTGNGSKQEFRERDQVTKKIKKSKQMQSAISKAVDQYKKGQTPEPGSLHFTPDNGGYELYLGIQHCSYSISITKETKTTGAWLWKKEKTRYVATVEVSDIYNFDEIRDWNSFGSIANNVAYIYHLLGGGHDYEWTATFTQATKWETDP